MFLSICSLELAKILNFISSFLIFNDYSWLRRDTGYWSLDTCWSEAEIPSLAGMEKEFFSDLSSI